MRVTRKLLVSILAVILTLITLGATTFAWFTLTNVNSVGNIELNVTTGEGLLISLDGVTYTAKLKAEDIQTVIGNGLKFRPVSSVDGKNFSEMVSVSGDTVHNAQLEDSRINKDYVCFPIWFRGTNVPEPTIGQAGPAIYLTNLVQDGTAPTDATYINSTGVSFKTSVSYTDEEGNVVPVNNVATKYAKDATRLAFVLPDTSNDKIRSTNGKIFDLSATGATQGYGLANGQASYYSAQNPTSPITSSILSNLPTQTVQRTLTSSFNENTIASNNDSNILELTKSGSYYVGKVFVVLWIEGWDANCYEAIAKDRITCQLHFKLAGKYND
ncbi:MAG: hypothetical protein K6F59_03170 [Gammaproteobacteria bacterium]|nr:hypothetical protein [Gammaproteobacteria bacterium]